MSRPRGEPAATGLDSNSTVSVTCIADGRCHAVPDDELAIGVTQRSGQYSAVCGHLVIPAPMVAPDGEFCPACADRDANHRSRRRGLRRRR